ncbi:hypothetical protein KIW84_041145 [Lathyrus oleraceus]|uniref:Uncharacterized protein n=1 Tax=Pisum sativum TaxID=3888 RepID=A0A9D4X7V8_PEA|nr:hypothetical protein KIW84_041145 [Pisum sativum]
MDINPAYSCLLGRPWIHAAGAVTSTLHQKMKFVVDGKLVIVSGEEDFIISQLSSFRYIEADEDALETSFQALEISNATLEEVKDPVEKTSLSFASLKSARSAVESGGPAGWGQVINVNEKNDRFGLGYKPSANGGSLVPAKDRVRSIQEVFLSKGFIHGDQVGAVEDDTEDGETSNLIYRCEAALTNWEAVEIPEVFPVSKIINKPVEFDDPTTSYNFELPIYQTEEDSEEGCDFLEELERMLEHESKALQPHQEPVETINLGTEEDKKEVKVGTTLEASIKERLINLLQEYANVFAWSYQDMPGLDTDIVVHKLPLQPDCPPVKQKLRRARPDMALKICDEVKRQFDAGFLAVAKYPQWVANIVPVPKKDGKVRMCVDYRDLNKASPKDDFPPATY